MHFHILTLFPEVVESYLTTSILGRAQAAGVFKVSYYNPRDYTTDQHQTVDDKPYGGGPGMVMLAEPILKAWKDAVGRKKNVETILFSPGGEVFTNRTAKQWSADVKHLVLICGRYEGVDDRVRQITGARELSVGDYVLTGGEIPAMIVVDAVARQMPGTLGSFDSVEESRVAGHRMFTRPAELLWKRKKHTVPDVLLSGNHAAIDVWRREN